MLIGLIRGIITESTCSCGSAKRGMRHDDLLRTYYCHRAVCRRRPDRQDAHHLRQQRAERLPRLLASRWSRRSGKSLSDTPWRPPVAGRA